MAELQARVLEWLSLPYIQALLLVVGSLFIAKLTDLVLTRALLRLAKRTQTTLDERIIETLHRPILSSVVLLGLYLAMTRLDLPSPFPHLITGTIKTLAILLWTGVAFRVASALLDRVSRRADRVPWLDARTLPLFDNLAKLAIFGVAIYFIFLSWQIDVTAWLASAGIIGLALGFAAKDTLANLFGGLSIFADKPFKVGDFIMLDTGERGRVARIGLRSTRILTRDDIEITLPNAQVANAKIVNESGGPWEKERVRVTVGVAYGSDIDHVRRVLLEVARSVEHTSPQPEPRVRFVEFGDSALVFQLLCWVDEPVMRGRCIDALNTEIYKRFMAEGIRIPFPQRDVHMHLKEDLPEGR